MCGITGIIDLNGQSNRGDLMGMLATLEHRGPDSYGTELYDLNPVKVCFGHARLSIIDLSEGGHQPKNHEHLSIVFNGEIYNYAEIRKELEALGHRFATHSDTEVILHAFEQWHTEAVHRFIGMFAFCLLDRKNRKVYLFRDRAGVKPLYVYQRPGIFLFGSELKSLGANKHFEKEIEPAVMPLYLQHGYIPGPHSIYKNCSKVLPGEFWEIALDTGDVRKQKYWDARDFYIRKKSLISYEDARQELKSLLLSAAGYRMVADVPVGVFLSGGFDSSLVTALLQSDRTDPLKTFTIGFEEGNNEAPVAREISAHLGTDHTEHICTTKEAQEIIPQLPFFYDEPFGDSSAIPTMLVSRMAREKVTVALSADAGDEVFFGYTNYFRLKHYFETSGRTPQPVRSVLRAAGALGVGAILKRQGVKGYQAGAFLESINPNRNEEASALFRKMNEKPVHYITSILRNGYTAFPSPFKVEVEGFREPMDIAMYTDYQSYLPDDILTKVDRATMSVSLEGREPLLDHRLIEFAAGLPLSYKFENGEGKRIIKDIVYEYLPKELMNRPKTGFTLPIYSWLRGDLSELIDEYLNENALKASGLFNVPFVLKEVERFRKGTMHYANIIWYLLMFQMWHKRWME